MALISAAAGAAFLAGWLLGIPSLLWPRSDFNPLRFNTALALFASALGLWFAVQEKPKWADRAAAGLGWLVFAIGTLTAVEYLTGWNLHIDQLFWNDLTLRANPVRMAPDTTAFFPLAGLFLMVSPGTEKLRSWVRAVTALAANLIAQFAILELIFFKSQRPYGTAPQTAAVMLALSLGMLSCPGRRGPLAPLLNPTAGGRLLRRLFPAASLAPTATAWVCVGVTMPGSATRALGITAMVLLYTTILVLMTVWTANSLDSVDMERSALVDSSEDAILSNTLDGTITSWNRGAQNLYGYTAEETIGRSVYMLSPPEQQEEERQLLESLRRGEPVWQHDTVRIRKDGSLVDVSVTLSPVRNARGEITRASVIARDITEQKRAQLAIQAMNRELEKRVEERTAELRTANQELQASTKELEAFAYSVSHDLRAPLRHLDGFLSLLKRRSSAGLDEQGHHYLDSALRASERMGQLIDELLQFSRLGRAEIHKTTVDLNQVVEEARKELEPAMRGREIRWQVEALPQAAADVAMLRQVIENLLDNALKFTRKRQATEIRIGTQAGPEGDAVVFVEDNGAGFDMRYYDKLFEVFQRLHSENEFEGTGIGLANVRRIIERHGGRVWAEGEVGKGATFYFSLPGESTGGNHEYAETDSAGGRQ